LNLENGAKFSGASSQGRKAAQRTLDGSSRYIYAIVSFPLAVTPHTELRGWYGLTRFCGEVLSRIALATSLLASILLVKRPHAEARGPAQVEIPKKRGSEATTEPSGAPRIVVHWSAEGSMVSMR